MSVSGFLSLVLRLFFIVHSSFNCCALTALDSLYMGNICTSCMMPYDSRKVPWDMGCLQNVGIGPVFGMNWSLSQPTTSTMQLTRFLITSPLLILPLTLFYDFCAPSALTIHTPLQAR